jgi:hypothetical protein
MVRELPSSRIDRRAGHKLTSPRAGCNFSAISGTDANALKWDRDGYAHLTKLAEIDPVKSFVEYTPSTEFWEETVPHEKIQHMSGYLKDVRSPRCSSMALGLGTDFCSSKSFLTKIYRPVSSSASPLPPYASTHPSTSSICTTCYAISTACGLSARSCPA